MELRSFRSLRLAFLASPRILGSLNGGKKEDAEVLEGVEKGQNGKEGEKEGTAKVEEKTELKTIETTEEAAKIEKETTEAPPPPTRTSTERHQHTNSPSHLPREQVVPQRTEGTKWGGGWWNATVAAATSALALAGFLSFFPSLHFHFCPFLHSSLIHFLKIIFFFCFQVGSIQRQQTQLDKGEGPKMN